MKIYPVSNELGTSDPEEFLEQVSAAYDGVDPESVLPFVADFRKVANNQKAFLARLHSEIDGSVVQRFAQYSQSSWLLAGVRGQRPFLRVNMWPPIDPASAEARDLCKAYSYYLPHNHNFSFLTTNYLGEGYTTEVWEITDDTKSIQVGQEIKLAFAGKFQLSHSSIMLYEAEKDVHVQFPPSSLSLSLNLMLYSERDKFRPQHFFEPNSRRVVGESKQSPGARRLGLINMAAWLGTEETADMLDFLSRTTDDPLLRKASHGAAEGIRKRSRNESSAC
ncbi:hypothetical protein ACFWZ4_12965 [Frateuria sp. GZRe12]|uniref:hypothetical protein n=1 Tax=Frateuria sp. GZRe12 TaxID=3351533 RepID=UPI003EDCA793